MTTLLSPAISISTSTTDSTPFSHYHSLRPSPAPSSSSSSSSSSGSLSHADEGESILQRPRGIHLRQGRGCHYHGVALAAREKQWEAKEPRVSCPSIPVPSPPHHMARAATYDSLPSPPTSPSSRTAYPTSRRVYSVRDFLARDPLLAHKSRRNSGTTAQIPILRRCSRYDRRYRQGSYDS